MNSGMKHHFSFLIAATSLLSFSFNLYALTFEWPGLAGGSFSSNDFSKENLVIQFWASWCTSCGQTMGSISKELPTICPNKAIKFITVNVDEDINAAKEYFKKQSTENKSLESIAYFDKEGSIAEKMGVKAIPTIFLVKAGNITASLSGHPDKVFYEKVKGTCVP